MATIRIIGRRQGRQRRSPRALRAVGDDVDGPLDRTSELAAAATRRRRARPGGARRRDRPRGGRRRARRRLRRHPPVGLARLDVLAPHPRRASMHPLVPLPNAEVGAERLLGGVTLAVAGDPLAAELGTRLGARLVEVADEDRACVPRGRLRRGEPRRRAARPGRAHRRDGRPRRSTRSSASPAPRSTTSPRSGRAPRSPGPRRAATGRRSRDTSTRSTPPSAPVTAQASRSRSSWRHAAPRCPLTVTDAAAVGALDASR